MIKNKKTFKAQTMAEAARKQAMAAVMTLSISSNMHNTMSEKQLYLSEPVMKKANEQ